MKLYEGDLIVRGYRMLLVSGGGQEVDLLMPPMSYLIPGTIETPPMWMTPKMVDADIVAPGWRNS